jgi:hypothetical protein
MANKTRGTQVGTGETITLKCLFNDQNGMPVDLDEFPSVQIIRPDTSIMVIQSNIGVYKIGTGLYGKDLTIGLNEMTGVFTDNWFGLLTIGGVQSAVRGSFNFVVANNNLAAPNIDGYLHLGDEPVVEYSQQAIANINFLIKLLKMRLQSSSRHPTVVNGNIVYENCDIFSTQELTTFLCLALSEFNSTPHFTNFVWEDQTVIDFRDILVYGAYITALFSKATIEKGREFAITDNGVSFTPPMVADLLNSQATSLLADYRQKLQETKHNFKPSPIGLGTLRITAVAPQILRLRHRRSSQFLL